MNRSASRIALAALSLGLLYGCAAPSPPAASSGATLLPAAPAACVAENQACDATRRCCQGTVCVPTGRFGSLCRLPFPG
jgi:hypothetical protein